MPLLYLVLLFAYPIPNSPNEVESWLPRSTTERAESADFLLAVCRIRFEVVIAELKAIKGAPPDRERKLRHTAVALLIAIDRLEAAKNPKPRAWLPAITVDPFDPDNRLNKLKPPPKPPLRD